MKVTHGILLCRATYDSIRCNRTSDEWRFADGYCITHYSQKNRGIPFQKPRARKRFYTETVQCEAVFDDGSRCPRMSNEYKFRRGMCPAHDLQKKNGSPLRPVARVHEAGDRCEAVLVSGMNCPRIYPEHRLKEGMCHTHRRQYVAGKPLTEVRSRRTPEELAHIKETGFSSCRSCEEELSISEFQVSDRGTPALDCKNCKAAKHTERMYGLSREQFDALLDSQGGGCAICGAAEAGYGRRWHIDHDHGCCPSERACGQCVRGILCLTCNARGLPWYERLPEHMKTINPINEYLKNPPGQKLR
ncbi:endonuclease domain-containing protein [Streptomyces netropsis]|uniref:endonuclease domain-containing protein n=1 Tax=Streptomyces netropsis TaxID=55404 RepID=UPI003BB49F51